MLALCAVYLACFNNYRQYLAPGEKATILIIATDRKQARVILRYIAGLIRNVPMLAKMLESQTAESFELSNGIVIEVGTASMRAVRGYTLAAVLFDEIAYFPTDDSADPDHEIIAAVRPGTLTIPNAMLLFASSPHAKRGALFEAYEAHFGNDASDVLVWRATTREMNPTVSEDFIEKELAKDRAKASAEYLAEFRDDLAALVTLETVRACIRAGVTALMPHKSRAPYCAFTDPSGGSSDSMTLAIAHYENEKGKVVIDYIAEEKPPFTPSDVVKRFCEIIKSYGCQAVSGDAYGKEWVAEQFRKNGVTYKPAEHNRTELYLNLLPALNSGGVMLLDHPRLVNQLVALQRRVTGAGREMIDHPPNSHDDVANAVAGAVALASRPARVQRTTTTAYSRMY